MRGVDRCPACGSGQINEVVVADPAAWKRYLAYSEAKYGGLLDGWMDPQELCVDSCVQCGHHWYRNQPDLAMLAAMYAGGRRLKNGGAEISRNPTDAMRDQMRRLFRLVGIRARPSLLDYGSGFGRWSRAAASVGFDVTAYEPTVERGVEDGDIGFSLVHDRAALAGTRYDAVNLEQVLEHIPEPHGLLSELRELCTRDTIVRITVPNILRCPEGRNLWKEWPYNGVRAHTMAPFEHLHGFTPRSLRMLVRRAGFVPVPLWKMARIYPLTVVRRIGGMLFPRLDQTFLILMPGSNND